MCQINVNFKEQHIFLVEFSSAIRSQHFFHGRLFNSDSISLVIDLFYFSVPLEFNLRRLPVSGMYPFLLGFPSWGI